MKGESNERVHDSQRTGLDGRRIRKQSILLYPPDERRIKDEGLIFIVRGKIPRKYARERFGVGE